MGTRKIRTGKLPSRTQDVYRLIVTVSESESGVGNIRIAHNASVSNGKSCNGDVSDSSNKW